MRMFLQISNVRSNSFFTGCPPILRNDKLSYGFKRGYGSELAITQNKHMVACPRTDWGTNLTGIEREQSLRHRWSKILLDFFWRQGISRKAEYRLIS